MTMADWLRENGPATNEESPYDKLLNGTTRRAGVRRLYPTKGPGQSSGAGHVVAVYYLPEHHTKEEVLRKFFEANPAWVELSGKELVRNFPPEFRDTARGMTWGMR